MNFRFVVLVLLLASAAVFADGPATAPTTAPAISGTLGTPIELYNGKDFTGWVFFAKPPKNPTTAPAAQLSDTWSITPDGILHCTGKPTGYIRTEKSFDNYVITVEQRHLAKGNGGVIVAITGPDKVWPRCIEVQGQAGDEGDYWNQGSLKFTSDPARTKAKRVIKIGPPSAHTLGEWDTMEITVDHGNLSVKVNGQLQNVITDAESLSGQIGIQSEGGPMDFRKIELTPIQ